MEDIKFIIIQPKEVEQFKGIKLKDGSFLDPVELEDGNYFITDRALSMMPDKGKLQGRNQYIKSELAFKDYRE